MYKNYAIIQDGVVVEYPVDPRVWLEAENSFNVHEYWEGGELDGKTYVFCHNKPPACAYDEDLVEKTPSLNSENGLWYRQYDVVKVNSEILNERRKIAQKSMDELLSRLLKEIDEMAKIISELDIAEQTKWKEYRNGILAIQNQPHYPFDYVAPFRPDYDNNLKIKVTRI